MRIPWDGGKWVALSPHPNDTTAQRLDETCFTGSMGRKQSTTVINESGLYNVILRSDKPETI